MLSGGMFDPRIAKQEWGHASEEWARGVAAAFFFPDSLEGKAFIAATEEIEKENNANS